VPHEIIRSWYRYTGRWWVGSYIWYSEEGTVPNVTHTDSKLDETATATLHCASAHVLYFIRRKRNTEPNDRQFIWHCLYGHYCYRVKL